MSGAMERKLDKVLRTLENLTERMDKLDFKLETFDNRLNKLERLFNDKINKLKQALKNKSYVNDIDNIHTKLNRSEQQKNPKNLMQESYDQRLNLLIHGLEESNKTDWEIRESTQETIYEFFQKGLQIKKPRFIQIIYCHQLPQRSIYKNNIKVNRPVIINLLKRSIDAQYLAS